MNVLALPLALVLAAQDVTPEICADDDNACNARRYERRAKNAAKPRDRALHLHNAHLSFRDLYDETRAARDLCEARRTFDASVSVPGQPESQRASFEAERAKLEERERAAAIRCNVTKRAPRPRPLVAGAVAPTPAPEAAPPPVADKLSAEPAPSPVAPPASSDPPPPLLAASPAPRPEAAPPEDPLLPVRRSSVAADARPGRSLVIAGGATLAVGLGLAGAAGYTGSLMVDARRAQWELLASVDGYANDQQLAEDAALHRRDRTMRAATLALGLTGSATMIVGAVLVGVGARRMTRTPSRMALLPALGGLVFRARF
jgi:hypothetical protein